MNKNYNNCIYACKKGYGCRFRPNSLVKVLFVEDSIACGVQLPTALKGSMLRVQLPAAFKGSMLRVQLPTALKGSMLRVQLLRV